MRSPAAAPSVGTTAPPLRTAVVPAPGRVVVRLTGDADVWTSPRIADALSEAAGWGTSLILVDVAGTRFWDVSGLHALAAFTAALVPSGRECRLVGASASTRRLVALADFTHSLRLDGPVTQPDVVDEPAPATESPEPPRRPRSWRGLRRRATAPRATEQDLSQTVESHRWR